MILDLVIAVLIAVTVASLFAAFMEIGGKG